MFGSQYSFVSFFIILLYAVVVLLEANIFTENAAAVIVSAIFSLTKLRILWSACILLQIIPG